MKDDDKQEILGTILGIIICFSPFIISYFTGLF
jgi:hypothetical protein